MLEDYLSLFTSPPATSAEEDEDDGMGLSENTRDRRDDKDGQTDENVGNPAMYYLKTVDSDLLQVLWGLLSCHILVENWEGASAALTAVKTAIETLAEKGDTTALEALEQRTWLLHWSLFVFWNDSSKGLENMVELFTTERYLQAITTNAPHLLRYLTASVLLCKRRLSKKAGGNAGSSSIEARRLMKDLVKVMQHCDYTDPIVEFVDCLCVKFDFDSAQTKLAECEHVLATDFFLCKQTALFMEEARVFVFENYCRIHHKIDLSALGEKLAMDQDQAERWIVDLIRNALLDAKIDSEERCVVMGADSQSVYEQVMERTRDLNVRSGTLAINLANMLNETKKEKARKARAAREEE
jgi:translation initiation factor 3 subunit E